MPAVWIGLAILGIAQNAEAQYQQSHWLKVAYTYSDVLYKEPGAMSERGRFAGIDGEVGFNFFGVAALSAGGEYMDGNLNYDGSTFGGTPVKVITKDYFRDLRLLAHVVYAPLVISYGLAERYWYDDLVISYRRRTQYRYSPLLIAYHLENAYVRIEHDVWIKGTNTSQMADVNPSAHDVNFTLGNGSGFGVELGYNLRSAHLTTQFFVRYHQWRVNKSDVQSDGTQYLIEPDNTTTTVQGGIGVIF